MSLLLISQIGLWIAALVMASVIVALARQIGVLHERLAPLGPLTRGIEPAVGLPAPRLQARSLGGTSIEVGAPLAPSAAQLLLFVGADCPICKQVIPLAQERAQYERLDLLWVGVGEHSALQMLARQFGIDFTRFIDGAEIASAFRVGAVPYAVLLDPEGLIAAMGLVNGHDELERLLLARERVTPKIKVAGA